MNLNQVTIAVTNVERSIHFYEKLGLRLIVKSLPEYARFECPEGEATFSLHKGVPENNGSIWIYFEIKDLDNTVSKLTSTGIVFEEMPNDKQWLWREARLKDPDNHQLIFYFAAENRKNPPWRIQLDDHE